MISKKFIQFFQSFKDTFSSFFIRPRENEFPTPNPMRFLVENKRTVFDKSINSIQKYVYIYKHIPSIKPVFKPFFKIFTIFFIKNKRSANHLLPSVTTAYLATFICYLYLLPSATLSVTCTLLHQ